MQYDGSPQADYNSGLSDCVPGGRLNSSSVQPTIFNCVAFNSGTGGSVYFSFMPGAETSGNLSALTQTSLQLVVEVSFETAAFRREITSSLDLDRGIIQIKLIARIRAFLSGATASVFVGGLLQWIVRESQRSKSPASIWQVIGFESASSGSLLGNRK